MAAETRNAAVGGDGGVFESFPAARACGDVTEMSWDNLVKIHIFMIFDFLELRFFGRLWIHICFIYAHKFCMCQYTASNGSTPRQELSRRRGGHREIAGIAGHVPNVSLASWDDPHGPKRSIYRYIAIYSKDTYKLTF